MKYKIDNNKAVENVRKYLSKETDADYVAAVLDDAYTLLAESAATAVDSGNVTGMLPPRGSLCDTMYNLRRLREVIVGE